ncbi:hypothetical protein TCAL_04686 [Tigriopus californicus]|uniref:NADP-dependent oxidoreductase domain-containing protein n=1 Tax=Tigriopus californicus TaxID=6832 RepID=A0A553NSQ9_TIGCA|nr:hypothetical protein TCAL_04686 [Tigriopus californicus]
MEYLTNVPEGLIPPIFDHQEKQEPTEEYQEIYRYVLSRMPSTISDCSSIVNASSEGVSSSQNNSPIVWDQEQAEEDASDGREIPEPPPPPTFSLVPPSASVTVNPVYANMDSQDDSSEDERDHEADLESSTNVTRLLIKHLPKQMAKLRHDKAELEDKIQDLEARISQQAQSMSEMERRSDIFRRDAEQANAIIAGNNATSVSCGTCINRSNLEEATSIHALDMFGSFCLFVKKSHMKPEVSSEVCPLTVSLVKDPFSNRTKCVYHNVIHKRPPVSRGKAVDLEVIFGTFQTTPETANLLHSIGGGHQIHQMTTRFYTRAFQDHTLSPFMFEDDGAANHGQRLGDWIIEKMGGEGPVWSDSGRRDMRQVSHFKAWNSKKRSPVVRGNHFKLTDCRVWMRLMFWAGREVGLDGNVPFWEWYQEFIQHFIAIYERTAPPFTEDKVNMDNPKGYTLSPAVSVPPTYDTAFHGPEVLKNMPYYQLGETDMIVSKLSLGGTALGSGSCDQEMVDNILWTAVKAGVNYFDTSPWYGSRASEKVMGKALKKLPRNTYYIATKVGRYLPEVQLQFDFTRQRVRDSVLESMAHLQVDYLDLVQVHDVEFCRSMGQIVQHTLPALNELKAEGKIRYIGITGYNLGTLKRIVELSCDGTVDTVLSYCRFSLFNTDLMSYSAFFESRRIGVINASPVGMGLITPHAVPTWHPATKSMKVTCSKAAIYCEKMGINLEKETCVKSSNTMPNKIAVPLPPTYVEGFHNLDQVLLTEYQGIGNTNLMVSNFGLGGSGLASMYGEVSQETANGIVEIALKGGVNYIDTAPWYGQGKSEMVLGEALKSIPRRAYYVGRYEMEVTKQFDFTRKKIRESVEKSMALLGLDYLDLVQIHDVEFCHSLDQIVQHSIPELIELKKEGKIKHIGITGYSIRVMKRIVEQVEPGTIDTILSYCHYNLFNQDLLDFKEFFTNNGIGIINASPVGMGLLSPEDPPKWHGAFKQLRTACSDAAKYCHAKGFNLSSLAVKWCLRQKEFPTTLSSVTSQKMMEENLKLAQNHLTPEESEMIADVQTKFFKPLVINNWENVDVNSYWTAMEKKGSCQPSDLK